MMRSFKPSIRREGKTNRTFTYSRNESKVSRKDEIAGTRKPPTLVASLYE